IRNSKVRIEPVAGRKILRQVPEVPFTNSPCAIASFFQKFRNRDLALWDASVRIRKEHPALLTGHATANWKSPGQQTRPRRRTDIGRAVEGSPSLALARHLVDIGRRNGWMTITSEIAISLVIR